jgi:nicotinamidase-related amidase
LKVIQKIHDDLIKVPSLSLSELEIDKTVIVIIDMIKGFAIEGALSSKRVTRLIEPIAGLIEMSKGAKKVFLCDRHSENSSEFLSYLPHAIQGTEEALIVDELYALQDELSSVIFKNSTNGMMTKEMRHYLEANPEIKHFIIVGDCSDICVLQFALGLRAYYNEKNIQKDVIVPMAMVDTFNLLDTQHDAGLMNLFTFYNMKMNGIMLARDIQY